MNKLYGPTPDPIDRILKRQSERRKTEEKNNLDLTNYEEIEKFTEDFNEKQKEIGKNLSLTETIDPGKLYQHFSDLNDEIQMLQRFYSNATIFLRLYDRKVCQATLHDLQSRLKDLENRFLPKKKFGFKNRTNKVDRTEAKNGMKKANAASNKNTTYLKGEACGFCLRENETLCLKGEQINKKDVLLADLKNCSVELYGNPSTLHMTNMDNCQVFSGPITTSVFVERVKDSSLHLACQQLRIHETVNTNIYAHITSKAIIEDSKDVRFGIYKLNYEGLEDDYRSSGLNREVNNWDKVDDFNWLAIDKPSPNWSTLSV
ncbi:hypothetical protein RUM43_009728 [Polyplax serrata]|uniref:C-CAP/cofactor C-like domain-containing protein n=1 Tax=Polyplax serrata TaxID=468196 RepID=A0AAN8PUR8_POLSC